MGRWAIFSTGIRYKFSLGIQPSEDIAAFGGIVDEESYDEITGTSLIQWIDEDRILAELRLTAMFQEYTDLPNIEIVQYLATAEGTAVLQNDLWTRYGLSYANPVHCRYVLGCLILHQLMYSDALLCSFEY